MAWILVVLAGLLEIGWVAGLRYADGFTKPLPSIFTLVTLTASMVLLSLAARTLPLGTAYAVWVGIGATGAALLGIIMFDEPTSAGRLLFLGLLIVAIIGFRLTSAK